MAKDTYHILKVLEEGEDIELAELEYCPICGAFVCICKPVDFVKHL